MRLFRSEKEKQPSEVRPDKESTFPIWSGVVVGLLVVGSNSLERLWCWDQWLGVLGVVFGCCSVEAWYCLIHVCVSCCIMIRIVFHTY